MISQDNTEDARRALQAEVNKEAGSRKELEARYGTVWDSDQMRA